MARTIRDDSKVHLIIEPLNALRTCSMHNAFYPLVLSAARQARHLSKEGERTLVGVASIFIVTQ